MNQHVLDLMSFLKADTILFLTEDFADVGVGLLCPEIHQIVDTLRLPEKNEFLNLSCWQTVHVIQ